MKTKKGDKIKLRQKIIDTALESFKVHGRTGAATDAILDRAGLTKGALYSHFKSKDDLFTEAVVADLNRLRNTISQRIERSGPEALKQMIEDHLSEKTLDDIGNSCVLSSLSSDMNRCQVPDRKAFAQQMDDLYAQFSEALKFHFPSATAAKRHEMAQTLYATLVGAVSTARLQVDRKKAMSILSSCRKSLLRTYAAS